MAEREFSPELFLRETAATPGKRVLAVEGTADVAFLTLMLDKPPFADENIAASWVIAPAGGKDAVLRLLRERPDISGMVDRDAWDAAECRRKAAEYPHLHILPRFCIENYLILPDELSSAIQGFSPFAPLIRREVPRAVRHACLWRAAQPLYEALLQAGFNRALLQYPPPDETELQRLLTMWQNLLSSEGLHHRMDDAAREMAGAGEMELLAHFVHGKVFWRGCVEPLAARLFPGEKSDGLRRQVLRRLPVPYDLETFLRGIFLGQ